MQRAPGERLAAVSAIGERAGLEVSRRGPVVDQAEQLAAPDRRADRPRRRGARAHARLPLGRLDAADADRQPDRARRRHPAAALRRRLHRLPELRPDPRRDARPRRRDRLRAADRRPLPRAARGRRLGRAQRARRQRAPPGRRCSPPGAIVVVALAGLLSTGIPFVGRMGIGSAIVVASVAVGAVTVLPTLMGAFAQAAAPDEPAADGRALAGLRALGDDDHAPPARRGRRRDARARRCSRCRCSACGSASPTTATTAPGHDHARRLRPPRRGLRRRLQRPARAGGSSDVDDRQRRQAIAAPSTPGRGVRLGPGDRSPRGTRPR